ncbi:amidohydrolase family protein [Maribacter algicola]|uniref:Amidohydrolase family protein n=1 Tax=Meishania litoralis TaxID=3434685 RepID=A0ACC7LGR1_9FLAO
MQKIAILFLILCMSVGCTEQKIDATLLIKNVWVVDVKKGNLLAAKKDIWINGDRIVQIRDHKEQTKSNNEIIDGSGKYIIPGLWDMHAHPDDPEMWRMDPDEYSRDQLMPLFVRYGVTGIRDMAGSMEVIEKWRTKIRSKELVGPEIVACGPLIDGPNPMWDGSVGISDLSKVKPMVDSLKNSGADFLKIYSLLPDSIYFELSKYARQLDFPHVGHVPLTVTTAEASIAGMKSQEHLLNLLMDCSARADQLYAKEVDYGDITNPVDKYVYRNELMLDTYDEEKARTLYETFVKNETWHTPTISMWYKNAYFEQEILKDSIHFKYLPMYMRNYWKPENNDHLQNRLPKIIMVKKKLVEAYKERIGEMNTAGVGLLAGTDVGANPLCFPGLSLHYELQMLVESGLTPAEALRTATLNPALYFEKENVQGSVDEGKLADLVLLDANPLEDIENTKRINAVVLKGEVFDYERLQKELAMVERSVNR